MPAVCATCPAPHAASSAVASAPVAATAPTSSRRPRFERVTALLLETPERTKAGPRYSVVAGHGGVRSGPGTPDQEQHNIRERDDQHCAEGPAGTGPAGPGPPHRPEHPR